MNRLTLRTCEEPCWKVEHGILMEVVQCKDCVFKEFWFKHDSIGGICAVSGMRYVDENDFCSYGELKEDAK
jgi:hypothetical protein|nr:MAG TPA: hypothetical protein [Myoviridae sp. ct6nn14]